jgi:hypothetical protein
MRPYLYILGVLLVGGGIGFYLGQRIAAPRPPSLSRPGGDSSDDRQSITAILDRQREAYRLHDALLLLRDCANSYVEVDAESGDSYSFEKALTRYHEEFSPGKSVTFTFQNPDITVIKNSALLKVSYSKISDQYESEGFRGLAGQGVWLLSKIGNRWEIAAFSWLEERKQ